MPAKIIEVVGGEVCVLKVEAGGDVRPVVSLIDDPKVGDYVLVHAGAAMERLSPEQVEEILKMWGSIVSQLEGDDVKSFTTQA